MVEIHVRVPLLNWLGLSRDFVDETEMHDGRRLSGSQVQSPDIDATPVNVEHYLESSILYLAPVTSQGSLIKETFPSIFFHSSFSRTSYDDSIGNCSPWPRNTPRNAYE